MPAPEILDVQQDISDAQSALDSKQQEVADSLAQKNTQIGDLQGQITTKDARIAELELQVGSGIPASDVTALRTSIQALTQDIANTPT